MLAINQLYGRMDTILGRNDNTNSNYTHNSSHITKTTHQKLSWQHF